MKYELTPEQIKTIDEINLDKKTIDNTLEIALTYHSNRMNSIQKKEKDWWDEMVKVHNLDKTKKWEVEFTGPIACIQEQKE